MARQKKPPSSPPLLHALLEKLLERMLDLDHADAPFTLLGVERPIKHVMVLEGPIDLTKQKVWLGGVIDRIDRHKDAIRIVDYKTGLAHEKIANVAELFDGAKVKKHKAMFQLLFYGWLFKKVDKVDNPQPIIPYLLSIRSFFATDYKPGIFIQQQGNGKKYQRIEDMMAYTQPFEKELSRLLLEIFNPAIPFVQTKGIEICAHCPYVRICQRD